MFVRDESLFSVFLSRLVETPGPTGEEEGKRKVLEAFLEEEGVPYHVDEAGNLEVVFAGEAEAAAPLVLDAHLDVVGRGYGALHSDEKRFSGPGVADNLAAVSLLAFFAVWLQKSGTTPTRSLHLLFSTGEEGKGNLAGIRHYIGRQKKHPFAFLCLDLGMESYALSAVGSIRYRARVEGRGGHSWGDRGGKNAISVLMRFLVDAERLADPQEIEAFAPGCLTFNVGMISGGEGINLIARNAEAEFEFRSVSPLRLRVVEKELDRLKSAAAFPVKLELTGMRPASEAVESVFLEKALLRAALAEKIPIRENPISSNANAALAAGWPSITFGICVCGNIHRPDEFLEKESLAQGRRFFWRILENLELFSKGNPEI